MINRDITLSSPPVSATPPPLPHGGGWGKMGGVHGSQKPALPCCARHDRALCSSRGRYTIIAHGDVAVRTATSSAWILNPETQRV